VAVVRTLGLRFGVVINRADVGGGSTVSYCRTEGIPVLAEIPEDRRIAEASSRGELSDGFALHGDDLLDAVLSGAAGRVK
jgi:MinD superfamily P-loop ATPase